MSRTWDIERIERDGPLHGEVGSMESKFDDPWMWRLMLGGVYVVDSGRAEFRDDAITDLLDAWDKMDERLDVT